MKIDVNRALQRLLRRLEAKWGRVPARPLPAEKSNAAVKLPKGPEQAAASLCDLSTLHSLTYKKKIVETSRDGAHPLILEFTRKFQAELYRRGIPFYPFEFYRSPERQAMLKKQGRSKAGPGQSPHQYGLAVDLIHVKKLWDITPAQWQVIGTIGKEVARKANIKVDWGGDWNFWDPAHWQLTGWKGMKEWRDAMPPSVADQTAEIDAMIKRTFG